MSAGSLRDRTLNSGRLAQPCCWHFVSQRALEHLLGLNDEALTIQENKINRVNELNSIKEVSMDRSFDDKGDTARKDQVCVSEISIASDRVPVFLPGESQGRQSLVDCRLWGRTESDTTKAT